MFERLKSLPLTIVLTILIWMYAEAQFTSTRDGVTVFLRVAAPPNSGNVAVRVLDADSKPESQMPLQITLQGTREQLEAIYDQSIGTQASDGALSNLVYELSEKELNSDRPMDTVQMLNKLSYFRKQGVTVIRAIPAVVRLDVDQMMSMQRTVQFQSGGPTRADVLEINPDSVTVQVPQRLLSSLGTNVANLRVIATPTRDLSTLPLEQEQTINAKVAVEFPGARDDRVTANPQQISVRLRIPKEQLDVMTIADVPVWVSGPPALLARHDVDVQPKFVKVTVAGTVAALQPLRQAKSAAGRGNAEPLLRAYLDVQLTDQPSQELIQRQLRYVLPDGVQLRDGPRTVSFRLVENSEK